jgi:hypothetical protein
LEPVHPYPWTDAASGSRAQNPHPDSPTRLADPRIRPRQLATNDRSLRDGLPNRVCFSYRFHPFIVLHTGLSEITDPTLNEHFLRYITRVYQLPFLDLARVFKEQITKKAVAPSELFAPGRGGLRRGGGERYSSKANALIGNALGIALKEAGKL